MKKNEKQMDGRDIKCETNQVNTLWGGGGTLNFKECIKTNPRVKKKVYFRCNHISVGLLLVFSLGS